MWVRPPSTNPRLSSGFGVFLGIQAAAKPLPSDPISARWPWRPGKPLLFCTDYRLTATTRLNLEPPLASFSMAQISEEKADRKDEFTEDVSKAEESNASAVGTESDEDISTIVTGSRLALIFGQAPFTLLEAIFIQ